MTAIRLQRFLAQAGVAARRKAEELIVAGRVTVDGKTVTELGTRVDPSSARVMVDGTEVQPQDHFYLVLNKPKACLTSLTDPRGRRTVTEYLPKVPVAVAPVGRLDFYSEGVLLFTNDGDLAAALTRPESGVEKIYHVKVRGSVSERDLAQLRKGVRLDARTVTRPAQVDRVRAQSKHDWLVITLTEGKSRQIHRMLEALGHTVIKLQRVAFAGLTFHGLRVGDARELTQADVNRLYEVAGLKRGPRAVARGTWTARREDSDTARRARDRDRQIDTPSPTPRASGRKPKWLLKEQRSEVAAKKSEARRARKAPSGSRSSAPGRSRPSGPSGSRSSGPSGSRSSGPSGSRSSAPSRGRPTSGSRPSGPSRGRPSGPSGSRPSAPGRGRPSGPSGSRPSAPGRGRGGRRGSSPAPGRSRSSSRGRPKKSR